MFDSDIVVKLLLGIGFACYVTLLVWCLKGACDGIAADKERLNERRRALEKRRKNLQEPQDKRNEPPSQIEQSYIAMLKQQAAERPQHERP